MEYFKQSLWRAMSAESSVERNAAQRQWEHNRAEYLDYLAKIDRFLSEDMRRFLRCCDSFHDAVFSEIAFSQDGAEKQCRVLLTSEAGRAELLFQDVQAVVLHVASFQCAVAELLSWGYCELKHVSRHSFRLSVACDTQNELVIDFRRLRFQML